MKANIIGTGRMAKGIIGVLSKAYPGQIGLYSRDFNKAQMVIDQLEIEAKALSKIEQFDAEIIIHTLWYEDALLWVQQHKEDLKGKVLVDISNPFNEDFTDFITPYNTSSAEEIQKLIPDTHVVGAFKNTYWVVFTRPFHKKKV